MLFRSAERLVAFGIEIIRVGGGSQVTEAMLRWRARKSKRRSATRVARASLTGKWIRLYCTMRWHVARWQFKSILSKLESTRVTETGGSLRNVGILTSVCHWDDKNISVNEIYR